jgi:putative ABC transport system permease protein
MIGHLFRMVWNRRRSNVFIVIELLISFVALCGALTMVCDFARLWYQPLGFDCLDAWRLDVNYPAFRQLDEAGRAEVWNETDRIVQALSGMEEIVTFTPLGVNVPYNNSLTGYTNYIEGVGHTVRANEVFPAARETLGLDLVAGRWLREDDRDRDPAAAVITRDYARLLFGDDDPIDRTYANADAEGDTGPERRVVGVVTTWRQTGELDYPMPAEFVLAPWGPGNYPPHDFVLKIDEGVPAAFEEELLRTVQQVAPTWSFRVTRVEDMRASRLEEALTPLLMTGAVAVFLGVMVGLGLVGVLWQSVTRRTEEIGLRRALGATTGKVRWQILGELMALVTIAAGIGTFLFLQFVLLDLGARTPVGVYLSALGLTLLLVYSFVLVCGLYPGWLATRVRPAEALQYE